MTGVNEDFLRARVGARGGGRKAKVRASAEAVEDMMGDRVRWKGRHAGGGGLLNRNSGGGGRIWRGPQRQQRGPGCVVCVCLLSVMLVGCVAGQQDSTSSCWDHIGLVSETEKQWPPGYSSGHPAGIEQQAPRGKEEMVRAARSAACSKLQCPMCREGGWLRCWCTVLQYTNSCCCAWSPAGHL